MDGSRLGSSPDDRDSGARGPPHLDRDTGLGSWNDEQVIRAIREGITKEGNLIGPPMPIALYTKIADDDVKAMVAYLRSVPSVRNEIPESKYKIELHAEPPAKDVKAPPKTDKIAYGEYLVNVAWNAIRPSRRTASRITPSARAPAAVRSSRSKASRSARETFRLIPRPASAAGRTRRLRKRSRKASTRTVKNSFHRCPIVISRI